MRKPTHQTPCELGRSLSLALTLLLLLPLAPAVRAASAGSQDSGGRAVVKRPEPTLLVSVSARGAVTLDGRPAGTVRNTAPLTTALKAVFKSRARSAGSAQGTDRTVFIKAPVTLRYGEIVKVIDAVKSAGASPVGLVVGDDVRHAALLGLPQRPLSPEADDRSLAQHAPVRDATADASIIKDNSVIVSIPADGQTYLKKELVGEDDLEPALAALLKGLPESDRIVYVHPDGSVSYRSVVRVINMAVSAGATAVGLVGDHKRHS